MLRECVERQQAGSKRDQAQLAFWLMLSCVLTWSGFVVIWSVDAIYFAVLPRSSTDYAAIADVVIDLMAKLLYAEALQASSSLLMTKHTQDETERIHTLLHHAWEDAQDVIVIAEPMRCRHGADSRIAFCSDFEHRSLISSLPDTQGRTRWRFVGISSRRRRTCTGICQARLLHVFDTLPRWCLDIRLQVNAN